MEKERNIPRQSHEVVWNALQEMRMITQNPTQESNERLQSYFKELQDLGLLTNGEIQQLNSL